MNEKSHNLIIIILKETIAMHATIEPTIAVADQTTKTVTVAEPTVALRNDYGVVHHALFENRGRREATLLMMAMRRQVTAGVPAQVTDKGVALVVAAIGELFGADFDAKVAEAAARVQQDMLVRFA